MKTKIYKDKVQTSIKTKQLWICQRSCEKGDVQERSLPTLMAILKNWYFFLYAHRTEIYLRFNWSAVKKPQWSAAICGDSLYLPSPKWLSKPSHVPISTIHSRQRWELPTLYSYHVGVAPWTDEVASVGWNGGDDKCDGCKCASFARPRTASVGLPKPMQ